MTTQRCTKCNITLRNAADHCHVCGANILRRAPPNKKSKRQIRADRLQRRRVRAYAILMLIAGSLLLLTALAFSSDRGRSDSVAGDVPDTHDEEGLPYPEVPRIALQEAKEKFEGGTALFVDVRNQSEYETAHISNALSVPLADLETRYSDLPREAEIITYCT